MSTSSRGRQSAAQARAKFEAAQLGAGSGDTDLDFNDTSDPEGSRWEAEESKAAPVALLPSATAGGDSHEEIPLSVTPATPPLNGDAAPYGTGIEIEPDLHARVTREAGKTKQGEVRQTEIFLRAFETTFEKIPTLVAKYKNRHQITSPLFGTRSVQVAETSASMKRLQIRPQIGQYRALQALADSQGLPLAVLTRLVLRHYFGLDSEASSQRRRPKATAPTEAPPSTTDQEPVVVEGEQGQGRDIG